MRPRLGDVRVAGGQPWWKLRRSFRWSVDAVLRDSYRALVEQDRRTLLATSVGAPEEVVLVVARGERAAQVAALIASFAEESGDHETAALVRLDAALAAFPGVPADKGGNR